MAYDSGSFLQISKDLVVTSHIKTSINPSIDTSNHGPPHQISQNLSRARIGTHGRRTRTAEAAHKAGTAS